MTDMCQTTCVHLQASDDGLQALVCVEMEQLEGRPGGMGFALLPLAHRRGRRVQMKSEHRLAELQRFAQAFDVGSTEFPHRRRADRVELAHRYLADRSRFVERSQVTKIGRAHVCTQVTNAHLV